MLNSCPLFGNSGFCVQMRPQGVVEDVVGGSSMTR